MYSTRKYFKREGGQGRVQLGTVFARVTVDKLKKAEFGRFFRRFSLC